MCEEMVRFPLWWYGTGMRDMGIRVIRGVQAYARSLGFMVWLWNFFTPMFGRYDWQSRIISVLIRGVNIVFRGAMVLFFALCSTIAFLGYLFLPIVAGTMVLFHLSVLWSMV
jgi:hypothetical protein